MPRSHEIIPPLLSLTQEDGAHGLYLSSGPQKGEQELRVVWLDPWINLEGTPSTCPPEQKLDGLFYLSFPQKKVPCSSIWQWKAACAAHLRVDPRHIFGAGENTQLCK